MRAVARYCASSKPIHWKVALSTLGYVGRRVHSDLVFRVAGLGMQVFADADYVCKAADRRSVSGGLVMYGGVCVSWFSKAQKCITISTTEAAYVVRVNVIKEVLFLRQIWWFVLLDVRMPYIPLFENNEGAEQIAQKPITNSDSNHIDIRHHFLTELLIVGGEEISIIHVLSAFQHVGILTKAIAQDSFEFHRNFARNL